MISKYAIDLREYSKQMGEFNVNVRQSARQKLVFRLFFSFVHVDILSWLHCLHSTNDRWKLLIDHDFQLAYQPIMNCIAIITHYHNNTSKPSTKTMNLLSVALL